MISTSKQGFSLIEISLVLLLLSIMFTIFLSTMQSILSLETDKEKIDNNERCHKAIIYISRLIEQVYYVNDNPNLLFLSIDPDEVDESGKRLVFQTSYGYARITNNNPVREVTVLTKFDEEKLFTNLILREDTLVDSEPEAGGLESVLIENIREFRSEHSSNGESWQKAWNSRTSKRIPNIVRLTLSLYSATTSTSSECQITVFTGINRS